MVYVIGLLVLTAVIAILAPLGQMVIEALCGLRNRPTWPIATVVTVATLTGGLLRMEVPIEIIASWAILAFVVAVATYLLSVADGTDDVFGIPASFLLFSLVLTLGSILTPS